MSWLSFPTRDPLLREFVQMQRVLNNAFDRFGGGGRQLRRPFEVFPPLKLVEQPEALEISAELPGIDPDQLNLSLTMSSLTLEGERKTAVAREGVSYHRRERAEGRFSRVIDLPVKVAPDTAEASYRDGILTIRVAKSPELKPRRIAITAGE